MKGKIEKGRKVMWRKTLTALAWIFSIVLIFQIFFRYKILNNEGRFYRYDRLKGSLTFLEVKRKPTERTIALVKNLPYEKNSLGLEIQKYLSLPRMEGDINFKGWKAHQTKENNYLVSCTFQRKNNEEEGWWWEVNLNMDIVRPIAEPWAWGTTTPRYLDFGNPKIRTAADSVLKDSPYLIKSLKAGDHDFDYKYFEVLVWRKTVELFGSLPKNVIDPVLATKYNLIDSTSAKVAPLDLDNLLKEKN